MPLYATNRCHALGARRAFLPLIAILLPLCGPFNEALAGADDKAYDALSKLITVTPQNNDANTCVKSASVDFDAYVGQLAMFRDAWLNRDYSTDYYSQRRKQIFVYIIVKRAAELLTEGIYRKHPSVACSFSVRAVYRDKYGKPNSLTIATWTFDPETDKKVDWDRIDPRDFADIATQYTITKDATAWMSNEPAPDSAAAPNPGSNCRFDMLRANAVFIRATGLCPKNYMDTKAGVFALEQSKECGGLDESKLRELFSSAMMEFDTIKNEKGKVAACSWVDDLHKKTLGLIND